MVSLRRSTSRTAKSEFSLAIGGAPTPVNVVRSTRRRRTISVSVGATGVRVLAPMSTTDDYLAGLIQQRSDWIARRLKQLVSEAPRPLLDSASIPFRGEELPLSVVESPGRPGTVLVEDGEVRVTIPRSTPKSERAAAVGTALLRWYRAQAADLLPRLVAARANETGLNPAAVLIRNQRRRWGSCNSSGVIRLNWRLILLKPDLADYVVVHELAHLRHRHHQAPFWEEVARILPNHRELRRRLAATRALDYFAD